MSFEEGRKRRMDALFELLRFNPQGLRIQVIARALTQQGLGLNMISRARLEAYLKELEWAGCVEWLQDGRIKLRKRESVK